MNTLLVLALATFSQLTTSQTLCNDEGSSLWSCDIANGENFAAEYNQSGMMTLQIRLGTSASITDYKGWVCTSRANICTYDVGNPHNPMWGLIRVQTPTTATGSVSEISVCMEFHVDGVDIGSPTCES